MRSAIEKLVVAGLVLTLGAGMAAADQSETRSLFNGRNLLGWQKKSGQAEYRVENGAIVGRTVDGSPNTFLCTDDTFSDFVLTFEVKLDDNSLNSGLQVRSQIDDNGRVNGPQVEIEAAPPAEQGGPMGESGYIYGEATGRGWLSEDREPTKAFKNDSWNKFKVRAEGNRIQTWINGQKIEDLEDSEASQEGVIGLQVHGIPENRGPFEVRWRNIEIRELN